MSASAAELRQSGGAAASGDAKPGAAAADNGNNAEPAAEGRAPAAADDPPDAAPPGGIDGASPEDRERAEASAAAEAAAAAVPAVRKAPAASPAGPSGDPRLAEEIAAARSFLADSQSLLEHSGRARGEGAGSPQKPLPAPSDGGAPQQQQRRAPPQPQIPEGLIEGSSAGDTSAAESADGPFALARSGGGFGAGGAGQLGKDDRDAWAAVTAAAAEALSLRDLEASAAAAAGGAWAPVAMAGAPGLLASPGVGVPLLPRGGEPVSLPVLPPGEIRRFRRACRRAREASSSAASRVAFLRHTPQGLMKSICDHVSDV